MIFKDPIFTEPPCGGGHPEQPGGAVRQEGQVQGRGASLQAGAGNQVGARGICW